MQVIYYGANSWLWDFGHTRLLVDPWLVDDLVFGNLPWLFRGSHTHPIAQPDNVDAILLTQGLEDHAHRPTLAVLDRQLPVIASPSGAKVVSELGYVNVTTLKHGDRHAWHDQLEIQATPGAPIGLQRENGYIIRDRMTGLSLYYEPHGFYDPPTLTTAAPIDVVINPIVNLELPLVGAIIQGDKAALNLAKLVHAQMILPTAAGGDIRYDGILDTILRTVGSAEALRQALAAAGLTTTVFMPEPGQLTALPVQARVTGTP